MRGHAATACFAKIPGYYSEFSAHAAPATRIRITFDDYYLFSTAEDFACEVQAQLSEKSSHKPLQSAEPGSTCSTCQPVPACGTVEAVFAHADADFCQDGTLFVFDVKRKDRNVSKRDKARAS